MAFIDKDDLKVELGKDATDTSDDTLLSTLATSVLSLWNERTGRTWERAEHTEYYSTDSYTSTLYLKNRPIISISSIYDDPDWEYGEDTLIDSSDYTFNADDGIVYYSGYFYSGKNNIKITYTAGYTDENVPAWLKQILVRQACFWFKQAENTEWALASKTQPAGAGSITIKPLEENLLPEFIYFCDRNRNR